MNREVRSFRSVLLPVAIAVCAASSSVPPAFGQDPLGRPELDRSKPVPAKTEVLSAWQRRQDAIRTFRFAWTERQTHPKGWVSNPRYPERERAALPTLRIDRSYAVAKTLTVDGDKMRYSFELDRKDEPDGVIIVAPQGANDGLGEGKHYSYVSVFDGEHGEARLTSLKDSNPAVVQRGVCNVDAQNLDLRAILLMLRPLHPVMGDLLVDRAVTNRMRTLYKGRSRFILEERRDPSGWKTALWVEPERDFLVSRIAVLFEQKWIADIDIDHERDPRWGWVPSAWRISEMLADGSRRLVTEATVTSYSINEPITPAAFTTAAPDSSSIRVPPADR